LRDHLCGARRPCVVLFVRNAGLDRQNRPLLVATVDRGRRPLDGDESDNLAPDDEVEAVKWEAESPTLVSSETEDNMPPAHGSFCHRYEHWLVVTAGQQWTSQLLFASCNDGNGAAGVGVDRVAVEDGGAEIEHSGGSTTQWGATYDVSLDPPRVRSLRWSELFTLSPQFENGTWDWERFAGQIDWTAPRCMSNGEPPDERSDDEEVETNKFDPIPDLPLDPAFTEGGWRTTGLGGCAASVDSAGKDGFVVFGDAGAADDASLRVVASKKVLYVEIHDDRWVGPSSNWVADDHLELWTSRASDMTYTARCIAPPDTAAKQWGVRVVDGQVFAGYGHPDPGEIQVARAAAPGVVRLRIALPKEAESATVVYSDSDDGKHQKRLIATSGVRFGAGETLSGFYAIRPDQAVCETRNGRLEPRLVAPHRARDQAVVGDDGQ
jgi:hypothetical protein